MCNDDVLCYDHEYINLKKVHNDKTNIEKMTKTKYKEVC